MFPVGCSFALWWPLYHHLYLCAFTNLSWTFPCRNVYCMTGTSQPQVGRVTRAGGAGYNWLFWEPLQSWAPSSCQNCHSAVGQHCVPSPQPCVQYWIGCKKLMGPFLHGSVIPEGTILWNRCLLPLWCVSYQSATNPRLSEKPTEVAEKSLSQRERARGQGPARQSYQIAWHFNPGNCSTHFFRSEKSFPFGGCGFVQSRLRGGLEPGTNKDVQLQTKRGKYFVGRKLQFISPS